MGDPFVGKAAREPSRYEPDAAEVRRALAVLCDTAGSVEIRHAPGRLANRSIVRRGDDLDGLVSAVERAGRSRAVYVCLNPVTLDAPSEATASDEHVVRRRWLFLDIDSIRPDAKDNCATDAEKHAARQCADAVKEYLELSGWPDPVEVDSGNGYYLLYRIDLPNNEASQRLARGVLHALAEEFPGAKIDRCCHNASRIARVPGTWNRKGKDLKDRPYRMARLLAAPETIGVVSREQLVAVAGGELAERQDSRRKKHDPFRGRVSDTRLASYARRALDSELLSVALAVRGDDGGEGANNALNEAAFALGTLIAHGLLDEGEVTNSLEFAARRAGLDEVEILPTIRSGISAGKDRPRKLPDWATAPSGGVATAEAGAVPGKRESSNRWEFITSDGEVLAEGDPDSVREAMIDPDDDSDGVKVRRFELSYIGDILSTHYPEPEWIIKGVMSEGLNILAGAPKQGKSLLALNLALTVAGGGTALGMKLNQSDVLYLSLEDKNRRIKDRAVKMLAALQPQFSGEIKRRLVVATDWPRQDEGGLRMIDLWAKRAAKPGLLIIDVWNRFSPQYRQSGSTYNQDAEFMSEVKRFGERRGFSVLVIHHTRKPGLKAPEDFVHEISGTMGLSGTADGILALVRQRQEQQAHLHITGRDVEEQELILEFDKNTLAWKSLGTASEHTKGHVQKKVVELLKGTGKPWFLKDIAECVEEDYESVRKACLALTRSNVIRRTGNAYSHPGEVVADDEGEL